MKKKLAGSQSIQPLVIALYANSPFINGKLTKFLSYRSYIWTKTDNDRCGLLPIFCSQEFSFERYVDYLLDVPMYFVIRDNKYIDLTGYTFKDLIYGKIKNLKASFADWENHITTIFTEVRLKKIIEVRGADGGPWSRVLLYQLFGQEYCMMMKFLNNLDCIKIGNLTKLKIFIKMLGRMDLKLVPLIIKVF